MKEFFMKHPIISFLIVSEICDAIVCVLNRNDYSWEGSVYDRSIEAAKKVGKDMQERFNDKKEPIGFKAS